MKIEDILQKSIEEARAGIAETAARLDLLLSEDDKDELFKIAFSVATMIKQRYGINDERGKALFASAVTPVFAMLKVMKTQA